MDKKKQLIEQIKVVINKIEKDYAKEMNSGVLQLIYKRYKKALEILENNEDIKEINILGGVRAYMDSYNDYQNPLLGELHKAEKITKEL
ncbi:hypothetical protein EI200_04560 [Peribacillus simplex]|uniref:hypothetical protein n=1 Tax=Peribacillus simplex TaxID=1478 RepID=UPI000F637FFB|nr:hypothetical protein [Peribacillus simplex]RRN73955.1 hypothetical protein EI200_04560 [Peribacillus simplex]